LLAKTLISHEPETLLPTNHPYNKFPLNQSVTSPSLIGFEVFTAVSMKNAVFWDVAPCRSCEMNRRFGRTYRLSAATCLRWFHARGFFYHEDGGDTTQDLHDVTSQKTAFFIPLTSPRILKLRLFKRFMNPKVTCITHFHYSSCLCTSWHFLEFNILRVRYVLHYAINIFMEQSLS
jgi:hypothetical protein